MQPISPSFTTQMSQPLARKRGAANRSNTRTFSLPFSLEAQIAINLLSHFLFRELDIRGGLHAGLEYCDAWGTFWGGIWGAEQQ